MSDTSANDAVMLVGTTTQEKNTIHQLTTSKNVLYPSHNHLQTTGAGDLHFNYRTRWHLGDNQSVGSSAPVVSRWL